MLPFLKPKNIASVIVASRTPDGGTETKGTMDEMDPGLMSVAEDLIQAVHAKDAKGVVEALKSAQELLDVDDEPEAMPSQE